MRKSGCYHGCRRKPQTKLHSIRPCSKKRKWSWEKEGSRLFPLIFNHFFLNWSFLSNYISQSFNETLFQSKNYLIYINKYLSAYKYVYLARYSKNKIQKIETNTHKIKNNHFFLKRILKSLLLSLFFIFWVVFISLILMNDLF